MLRVVALSCFLTMAIASNSLAQSFLSIGVGSGGFYPGSGPGIGWGGFGPGFYGSGISIGFGGPRGYGYVPNAYYSGYRGVPLYRSVPVYRPAVRYTSPSYYRRRCR